MKEQCTEERFLTDVGGHQIEIIRDDGLYRHLHFYEPECPWNKYFDIVTWPGYLAYVGDMGDYAFSRIQDMFCFFRRDDRNGMDINPSYWAEKLRAGCREGYEKFDPDTFREVIKEERRGLIRYIYRNGESTQEERREFWVDVDRYVLAYAEDGEHEALRVANEFECEISGRKYRFEDIWERNFRQYTFHYLWACYAIVWGIEQYDRATELPAIAEKETA